METNRPEQTAVELFLPPNSAEYILHSLHPPEEVEDSQIEDHSVLSKYGGYGSASAVVQAEHIPAQVTCSQCHISHHYSSMSARVSKSLVPS